MNRQDIIGAVARGWCGVKNQKKVMDPDLAQAISFEVEMLVLAPIPMILWCPACDARHIDRGVFASKPHHTHACQSCGVVWRPAVVATVGVQFLPGFKD